ncbi:DUF4148 domain-containing protein [Bordetella genomosp. 13]|uniref:DUF4148 domain-containing protein n=1 Tax=Bordetella genomosp. 13 TaxID=463040 RepID=A0A1W6Z891_9BORD|nr:DUF4148 domain-containing protein [Bordetella genomosp. 13]ARP93603.1 hypothetical protein CAL15_03915 [Bordetella genomosp. 13]
MKTFASSLIIAATLMGANAYAADNIEPNNVPFQGVYGQQEQIGKTRAQVQAELQAAKAAGLVTFGESEQPANTAAASTLTREEVQADLANSRDNGLDRLYSNAG